MFLIAGCTASGKGKLAFELAQRWGTEILSIDSMKVYRRMDVGTAKPDESIRQVVRHHLIDVVEPHESFSAGRFVELADEAIMDMQSSNRPIIAVGGTALYIKGLLQGLFDGPAADDTIRDRLKAEGAQLGSGELHSRLLTVDPAAAERIHPNDLKRIVRALEVFELTGQPISSLQQQFDAGTFRHNWRLIGLRREKADASRRINQRVKRMIEAGLVAEVKSLLAEPRGLSDQAAQAVGYAEIIDHLGGQITLDDAIEKIKVNSRRLAKSQRTWFRSFQKMTWFDIAADENVSSVADRVERHIGH